MSAAVTTSVTSPALLGRRHALDAHPKGVSPPQLLVASAILVRMVNNGGRAIYPENVIAQMAPLSQGQGRRPQLKHVVLLHARPAEGSVYLLRPM